jgi:predicted dehydrogenase
LIGCGKIAWGFQEEPGAARYGICTHAAAWSALDQTQLVAVTDANREQAQRCADRWQVPAVCDDVAQLLEKARPQVVSVATPDDTHFPVARQCLEFPSVRAVLVEKPLARAAADAAILHELAGQLNKTLVVNYIRRFCPVYQDVRARISTGEFGPLRLAQVLYTKGLRHNGSHALDLMQYWFGRVSSLRGEVPAWAANDTADPEMDVTFDLDRGGKGVLHCLPSQDYTVFEADLCFEKARLAFTESGDVVEIHTPRSGYPFAGYRSLVRESRQDGCLRDYLLHAVRHTVAVMDGKAKNLSSAESSIALLEQLDLMERKTCLA